MRFHVDRSFAGDESMWLEEAAWRLEQDTRGKLRVEYTYDLNWDGQIQPVPTGEWFLVNLPGASDIAKHFDRAHGVCVLGETDTANRVVYLLPERLLNHDRFVHVTMHEVLHSIGIEHVVDSPTSIMTAIVVPHLPLRMSLDDLDAFCKIVDCSMNEVCGKTVSPSGGFSQWPR